MGAAVGVDDGSVVGENDGTEVGEFEGTAVVGDKVGAAVGAGVSPTTAQPWSDAHLAQSFTSERKSVQQFFLPVAICDVENIDKSDDPPCCWHTLHVPSSLAHLRAPALAVGMLVGDSVGRIEPPAAVQPWPATHEAQFPLLWM